MQENNNLENTTQPPSSKEPNISVDNTNSLVSSPVFKPSTSKGKPLFLIVGMIMLVVLVGLWAYLLNKREYNSQNLSNSQEAVSLTSNPNSLLQNNYDNYTYDPVPLENVLYFGLVDKVESIFVTNTQKRMYFDESGNKIENPLIGELIQVDGKVTQPFDYKNITKPKKIYLSEGTKIAVYDIVSIKLNSSKNMLYVSFVLEDKANASDANQHPVNLINKVYQINLDTLIGMEIWSNKIASGKYPAGGAVYIDQIIEDRFLTFLVADCYGCGGHQFTKVLVLNINSKTEKYLGEAGDLMFDLDKNILSYKKLFDFKERCEVLGMDCDEEGNRIVKKPAGQVYTENLP